MIFQNLKTLLWSLKMTKIKKIQIILSLSLSFFFSFLFFFLHLFIFLVSKTKYPLDLTSKNFSSISTFEFKVTHFFAFQKNFFVEEPPWLGEQKNSKDYVINQWLNKAHLTSLFCFFFLFSFFSFLPTFAFWAEGCHR